MCGSATGSWPFQACQSDRQTPVAPTAMTTPSAGQAGSAACVSTGVAPVPGVDDRLHEASPRAVVAGELSSSMLLTLPLKRDQRHIDPLQTAPSRRLTDAGWVGIIYTSISY